ncbi:hypothetical protein [Streptomyces sp. TRM70350]|nr:hypothetical protein [Streptomyces sp. TRM70350]
MLRTLRKRAGLSRVRLAGRCNVSPTSEGAGAAALLLWSGD